MAKILTLTLNPALDLTVELPRLEAGQVNRSDEMHTHAAGKGVNVAQVLADLGHQLTVSGFLGEDNLQAFETLFAKRGFVDAFIRVPGETRSNIKVAEQRRPHHRHQRSGTGGRCGGAAGVARASGADCAGS